ncbi:tRNA/rRNA methyltransferase (SpoU) [[Leptolyngbya] sp. PCC 7376]|uniref:TrmH family RNA methyltransferase n=1 Tax=[Leptolyngbya] sp. PCC 7376 TaxID=111781 RepID=UPI00029EF928|nr:RNA methyltransferase [[Leptolyngbya] sp. PCC 7376]AFY39377.1 tRNA/rRNA methyltransferase (SpoU) [[Leptolyngbya] sp. PCC 7376]
MLTSLQNPLIKDFRKLQKSRERRLRGLCLLEGTNLVEAAIANNLAFSTVLFTEAWAERYPGLRQKLTGDRLELVSPELLQKVATTVNPDGIVASFQSALVQRHPPAMLQLGVAIERLQDPGNLGTIIRTAAATSVDALLLSPDSVNPENPKVLRASVGAWFQTPTIVCSDFAAQIQTYRQQGMQAIATLPNASKTFWDVDWRRPSLILLGNEGAGLSDEIASLADEQVTIPMAQGVESLNAAIACSLLLYEAQRQNR